MQHRVIDEMNGVITFLAIVWAVFLLDWLLPGSFNGWGLAPRSLSGLVGIATMPFLHGGWQHILGNSVPLAILLCLLAGSRANSYSIVPQIVILGGALLWIFGRPNSNHVGASGLIYGLITFLIVGGFREGRIGALLIALFVGFMFGATLLTGILPISVDDSVSWEGHLLGAIAGAIIAMTSIQSGKNKTSTLMPGT